MPRYILLFALFGLFVLGAAVAQQAQSPAEDRWESAIRQFEEEDAKNPPVKGEVVFVGSSSIRLWDLSEFFPGLTALNRGFGGSQTADALRYVDRIVVPYGPRVIVFYAGDNDIAAGKSPEEVATDFKAFVSKVREKLPETAIIYISIKPSLSRWALVGKMRKANALIKAFCTTDERLAFVDVDTPMIGPDGKPRPELFVDDGLHLSPEGYALWTKIVFPYIQRGLEGSRSKNEERD